MKRFLVKADRVVEKVGDWALIVSGVLILVIGLPDHLWGGKAVHLPQS